MAGGALAMVVALVVGVLAFRGGDQENEVVATATPQEVVDRVVLRAEDLGAEWSPSSTSTAYGTKEDREMAACTGVAHDDPAASAFAGFERGDSALGAEVRSFHDAAEARAAAAVIDHPELAECAAAQGGGAEVKAQGPADLSGTSGARHLRLEMPVANTGSSVWLDLVSVARGRVVVSVFAVQGFEPMSEALLGQATDAMVGRI